MMRTMRPFVNAARHQRVLVPLVGIPSHVAPPVGRFVNSVTQTFHRLRDPFLFDRNTAENLVGTAFRELFLACQPDSFDQSCPPLLTPDW